MNRRHSARVIFMLLFCFAFTGVIALTEPFFDYSWAPLTQTRNCNWELKIQDAQEYIYEEHGETLKKITTVDIFATKKGGTDYFGKYAGKGVITVFNALSPDEDAYPVSYGGQAASTKEFAVDFRIDEKTDDLIPTWEFSPVEDRDFDGISTLQFKIQLNAVRGVFQEVMDWPGLIGSPGIEFEDGSEIAILYVDGGYVSLTLQKHWQIPAPFKGTLIGVPAGGSKPTQKPQQSQRGQPTTSPPVVVTPKPPSDELTRPPGTTPAITKRPISEITLVTIRPDRELVVIQTPTPTPFVVK